MDANGREEFHRKGAENAMDEWIGATEENKKNFGVGSGRIRRAEPKMRNREIRRTRGSGGEGIWDSWIIDFERAGFGWSCTWPIHGSFQPFRQSAALAVFIYSIAGRVQEEFSGAQEES